MSRVASGVYGCVFSCGILDRFASPVLRRDNVRLVPLVSIFSVSVLEGWSERCGATTEPTTISFTFRGHDAGL